jgi:hypothetical protein
MVGFCVTSQHRFFLAAKKLEDIEIKHRYNVYNIRLVNIVVAHRGIVPISSSRCWTRWRCVLCSTIAARHRPAARMHLWLIPSSGTIYVVSGSNLCHWLLL